MPLSESELASVKAKLVSCFDVLSALGNETRNFFRLVVSPPEIGRAFFAHMARFKPA